jgi:hypothetical protein
MVRMNYSALVVAVIAAFVASSLWYSPLLFGKQFMELSGIGPGAGLNAGPNAGKIVGELARNFILAYVIARFCASSGRRLERRAESGSLVVDRLSCPAAFGLGDVAKRTMEARRYPCR